MLHVMRAKCMKTMTEGLENAHKSEPRATLGSQRPEMVSS